MVMKSLLRILAVVFLIAECRMGAAAENHYSGYQNKMARSGAISPISEELGTLGPLTLGLALLVLPLILWRPPRTSSKDDQQKAADSSSHHIGRSWDSRF
jgi:hypothetical protein